ncbi:hypothetical protein ABLN97_03025 [Mycobacterium tuberculosis]
MVSLVDALRGLTCRRASTAPIDSDDAVGLAAVTAARPDVFFLIGADDEAVRWVEIDQASPTAPVAICRVFTRRTRWWPGPSVPARRW